MKIKKPKRIMSLFLAALMCVTSLVGMGTTAYAAEETDDVYLISFPRDGDSNYNAEWGHGSLTFMNGWKTGTSRYTTVRAMGSYEGNICYCIEIGVPQQTGDSFTKKGEDFWDNYPSSYNSTISPDDIKLFIGRIFQYGYTGTISTSWRSQNEGGDKLAHAVATQLLIWETVIGERDENFNKVSTGGKDAVLDQISPNHPLYDKIMSYYNSMAASVQKHSKLPSFLSKTPGSAQEIELEWIPFVIPSKRGQMMCSNETKTEKAGEEMAHKLKTIRADMLMLQYQLERELIRYVKRYLAQPRTTLITEDEQFVFMCELYDYVENTEFSPEMVSSLMKTKNVLELSWDMWIDDGFLEDGEDSIKKVAELLQKGKI